MNTYRVINSLDDTSMHGVQISNEIPYQIEFRNYITNHSQPKQVLDFLYIDTYSVLPELSRSTPPGSYRETDEFCLNKFVGLTKKAFDSLKDLLLLNKGEKVVEFYFERKPFYVIVPPAILPDLEINFRDYHQISEAYEKASSMRPEDFHYYRYTKFDTLCLVTDEFINRANQAKLTGLKTAGN